MPPPNPAVRLQGSGGGDVFYAVRSYVTKGGSQVCDIVNPDGMLLYVGCPVLNNNANRIGAPAEPWRGSLDDAPYPLVFAIYRSLGRLPMVIGLADNAVVRFTDKPVRATNGDTPVQRAGLRDSALANDGSKVVLKASENGGEVIISPESDLKIQLDQGAVMKVLVDGEASDGPVLAEPFSLRDAEIVGLLRAVVRILQGMRAEPAVNPDGSPNPNAGKVTYLPNLTSGPKNLYDEEVSALYDIDELNPAWVRSAVLALSSKPERPLR